MDLQSLPRYRGLPDSPRAWGEPNEWGELPGMHLRDYVVLALVMMFCTPMLHGLVSASWVYHQRLTRQDASRDDSIRQAVMADTQLR